MQLTHAMRLGPFVWTIALLACLGVNARAGAEGSADVTSTAFYERGGPLNMLVVNPAANVRGDIGERATLRGGWEADAVTGASVAVVDGPNAGAVDAITSATTVKDFRQVVKAGAGLRGDDARLDVGYSYGFENDYRSHAFNAAASTELFGRNTVLTLRYGRGWDKVCDLAQPEADSAVERRRMPTSDGCFEPAKGRTTHDLALHSIETAWTQNWTPIFNTQLSVSTQLLHGFQANPYRAVWLGRAAVQEHHPEDRARHALSLSGRLWIRPLGSALQLEGRAYRDSWDILAMSAEAALERPFGEHVRLRLRGRYYRQGAAAFFADDYALNPRGQYFSGDRELSEMSSWLGGASASFVWSRADGGRLLGMFTLFRLLLKADYLQFAFPGFHYGAVAIPNRRAVFGTLGLDATF